MTVERKPRRHAKAPDPMAKCCEPTGRLIGYARVSTADQQLTLQMDALSRAGVTEDHLHSDKVSGVAARRPGLTTAMLDCRRGDTLVVWKLDRVGRSLRDLLNKLDDLERRGVGFKSLTEGIDTTTPGGRLIMHVMGALAQFERDLIVERTKAGLKAKIERGFRMGPKPSMTPAQEREAWRLIKSGELDAAGAARKYGVHRQTIYGRVIWPRRKK